MAMTITSAFKKACLDGGAALFNSGFFRLLATATELAKLTFSATAFAGASTASPSVAVSNTITADNTVTSGTINAFELQNSGSTVIVSGSVGVGSGDLQITDNVIPGTATSVTCTGGLQLSLQIT